ncbi:uncharacterized protein [Embiotoca jacksoni]|uniref:uncharacterized protein n=1 Tax=Embiotoca jacksoni TaxID=100190 RepID=UPI003704346A
MHWLPLVAMVIASALPFPHNPVSRIAAAAARGAQRHEPAARLDAAAAPTRRRPRDREDCPTSSSAENQGTHRSDGDSAGDKRSSVGSDVPVGGRTFRTEDVPRDASPPKDYAPDGGRRHRSGAADFSQKDVTQESKRRPAQVSVATPTAPSGSRRTGGGLTEAGPGLDGLLGGDELLLDAHPRVLFSPSPSPPDVPPLLLLLETGPPEDDGDGEEREDADGRVEGHGDRATDRTAAPRQAGSSGATGEAARPVKRDKRSHLGDKRRGEKSVCEAESVWITNKTTATDSHGQKVTILQEIQTQTGPLKQYFYETRCRQAEPPSRARGGGTAARSAGTGVDGAGCLGVDKKQWRSECKAKQSYVRALTKDANNRVGWRWIRIDSSCVCVLLSRTNQPAGREVLTGKGRG